MLRIYSDREFLPQNIPHCQLLIPFWGEYHKLGQYSLLYKEGRDFLELVDIKSADIAVLPFNGKYLIGKQASKEYISLAQKFVQKVKSEGLKTIVLVDHDLDTHIPLDNVLVLRTSLNKVTRLNCEFALPAGHEDIVKTYFDGEVSFRQKEKEPTVGFCGLIASTEQKLSRKTKLFIKKISSYIGVYIPYNDGIWLRKGAMEKLSNHPGIKTNFIARDQYFSPSGFDDDKEFLKLRMEYINNIVESDYTLCVRGYGNFSFRFFETLSLGRIPLLLDTDCVLPYDFVHDYRDFCLIVPDKHRNEIGNYVADYHSQLTPNDFYRKQAMCREIWTQWLSPVGFYRNIPLHWT